MANNIFNNFNISYNSIADQKLTAANTLTVKAWNDIITILKTQANINATYLSSLNNWLIGDDPVSVPGENSFVDYINTYIGEMPNTVMDIVNKNSLGFTTIDIGYSTNYDIESDKELPTTKTVNKMLDDPRNSIKDINEVLKSKADLVDGKVPLEQLDTKETGELLVGTSINYDTSRDDQIPTTKAVDAMVNELKNSVDNKLTNKADLVDGKVPASQLPGYVDDVIEVDNFGDLPTPGESGKVYIVKSTNITYRWSGTQYTVIGKDLALGETSSTAFPGDRGKALELNTVKKTTEDVSSTPLYQIKNIYGNIVSAQFTDRYVLLVFGTVIENNACSLTIYDSGSIKQFDSIWLNYTLGQAVHMTPDYVNSYSNAEIDQLISASPMSTYEVDLTEASWVRLAKVKDLTKNSSGQFIFDCYGRKVNDEGTVIDTLENYSAKRNYQYRLEMQANAQSLLELMEQGVQFEIYYNCNNVNRNELILNSGDYEGIYRNLYGMTKYIGAGNIFGDTDYSTGVFTSNTIMHYGFPLQDRLIGVPAYKISVTAYNNAHNRFVPLYSLYKNGELLYTNTTFVNPDEMLGDDVTYSIPVDSLEQTDIIVIDFSAHNGLYNDTENEIVELRVSPYFDLNRITLSMTGALSGLEGVITYIQTPFPVNKITELGSHQEILTTSVFNVTCGLDDNGKLITDVLPITQSPELSGSDSSGGGSGGGDTGSGGSGLTGTHGLASILLENYEGETYVCGLINFPNTRNYLGTYIEMKIENNLNFETLNSLEVVDIEEKINDGEFQLLEGTTLENENKYDFVISTTLDKFKESISPTSNDFTFVITDSKGKSHTILNMSRGSNEIKIGENTYLPNNYVDINDLYTYFFTSDVYSSELGGSSYVGVINNDNLYEVIKRGPSSNNRQLVANTLHINLLNLSGTLRIMPYDSEVSEVHILWQDTEHTISVVEGYAYFEVEKFDASNSYISVQEDCNIEFMVDLEKDMDMEIRLYNVGISKDIELHSYNIPIDATVKGISYKVHKTSDSYDLFSVYNKLENVEDKINSVENKIDSVETKINGVSQRVHLDVYTSDINDLIQRICSQAYNDEKEGWVDFDINIGGGTQEASASGVFGSRSSNVHINGIELGEGFYGVEFILYISECSGGYPYIHEYGTYIVSGTYIRNGAGESNLHYNKLSAPVLHVNSKYIPDIIRACAEQLQNDLRSFERTFMYYIENPFHPSSGVYTVYATDTIFTCSLNIKAASDQNSVIVNATVIDIINKQTYYWCATVLSDKWYLKIAPWFMQYANFEVIKHNEAIPILNNIAEYISEYASFNMYNFAELFHDVLLGDVKEATAGGGFRKQGFIRPLYTSYECKLAYVDYEIYLQDDKYIIHVCISDLLKATTYKYTFISKRTKSYLLENNADLLYLPFKHISTTIFNTEPDDLEIINNVSVNGGSTDSYTKTETDDKLNLKADKADTYSKAEVNTELDTKADLVDGKVPASQLPGYVDDVLEYNTFSALPSTGESGKIYVTTYDNKTYRWSGSQYVEISQSLALGETSSTAYAGDKGKANADEIEALKTNVESSVDDLVKIINSQNMSAIPNGYLRGNLLINYGYYPITHTIGDSSFENCWNLKEIILGNNLISIEEYAFSGCSKLTSIEIPDSVISIGVNAFYNCNKLESITIPFVGQYKDGSGEAHFGYIFGASSYSYNDDYVPTSLKEVIITDGTSIGSNAFYNCNSIINITLPKSLTKINNGAFNGCYSLTNVYFLGTEEDWCKIEFSNYASTPMYNAEKIYMLNSQGEYYEVTSIEIPDNTTSIRNYQFYRFKNVTEVYLPNSVTSIRNYAFAYCSSLESIEIPDSVTSISINAFYGCGSLTSITVDINNPIYDSRDNCNAIIETESNVLCRGCINTIIPNTIKSICYGAFSMCKTLESIEIPESVIEIQDEVFCECTALKTVYAPGVEWLGYGVFINCIALTDIYLGYDGLVTLTHVQTLDIETTQGYINIHVKSAYAEQYATATNWSSLIDAGAIVIVGDYTD